MEWKDIKGYEGYYQVSSTGLVKTLERDIKKSNGVLQKRRERPTRMYPNKDGYTKVKLNRDGDSAEYFVHRLVAQTFVPNPDAKEEVNHINFNRADNSAVNLEWVTHAENIQKTLAAGRHVTQTHDFKGQNNPNYGNHILRDIYHENPDAIMELVHYGKDNGRACPVVLSIQDSEHRFDSMTACAEYLQLQGFKGNTMTLQQKIKKCINSGEPLSYGIYVRAV